MTSRDPADIRPSEKVTLRTVAAHAGVSKSVVSRYLQEHAGVSARSRAVVERSIRELGYRPNGLARSLTQRRTGTVGVLVNDMRQPWIADFLEGFQRILPGHGLDPLIGDGRRTRAEDNLLKTFVNMRFDGLVVAGIVSDFVAVKEAAEWIPTVVAGNRDFELANVDVVAQNDWLGSQLALDHLASLGHRSIAHINGGTGKALDVRADSYDQWMKSHGLEEHIQLVRCGDTEQDGYDAAVRLLHGDSPTPTAIQGSNDLLTTGVLRAAHDLGLRVPEDLALVSFDNSSLAKMWQVDITSVDIQPFAVGELTAQRLIDRIQDPLRPARVDLVTPTLAVRSSSIRFG